MYGKIFASMFKGSLYGQWEAIITFTCMIVLADKEGEVDMTAEALSAQTSIPLDIIKRGITQLEAPDKESRTPDEEGRRIIRVSDERTWGWRITNYAHYRAIRSAEERREYFRQHKRESRAKERQPSTAVHQVSTVSTKAVSSKQNAASSKQREEEEGPATTPTNLPADFAEDHKSLRRSSPSVTSFDLEVKTLLAGKHPSCEGATPEDVGRGMRALALDGRGVKSLAGFVRVEMRKRIDGPQTGQSVHDQAVKNLEAKYANG